MITTDSCAASPSLDDTSIRRMELVISYLLRGGVILSLIVILLGTTLTFVHHPAYISSPEELAHLVTPGDAIPHRLSEITAGLHNLRGRAIVAVGLLILIATPILRVATSIVLFARQGDRVFALITSVVLCLLLLSLVLGMAE
jgi:uncharacterized membrane protein